MPGNSKYGLFGMHLLEIGILFAFCVELPDPIYVLKQISACVGPCCNKGAPVRARFHLMF